MRKFKHKEPPACRGNLRENIFGSHILLHVSLRNVKKPSDILSYNSLAESLSTTLRKLRMNSSSLTRKQKSILLEGDNGI